MIRNLLATAALAVLAGCAYASSPVTGVVYSDVRSGLMATSNAVGSRVGEACSYSYLGAIAMGDSSVETARRNGGISLITSVDTISNSTLGIYAKYCTVVRGR
jgi:hypothetical protein